jgi:hypothetical protein
MTILTHREILRIHEAAIGVGLVSSRDALLSGIAPTFVASLPSASDPSSQILRDLTIMNAAERIADETMPLRIWLENAIALGKPHAQSSVFERARDAVDKGWLHSFPVPHPPLRLRRVAQALVALTTLGAVGWPLFQDPPRVLSLPDIVPDSAGGLTARVRVTKSASARCEWRAPHGTSCLPQAVELANKENKCRLDVEHECLLREQADVEVSVWAEGRCLWRPLRSEKENATWLPSK